MAGAGEAERKTAGGDFELDVELGRRHIIKRPRLTRLLDESKSRIIMLVAPAGYGKTTLAREWLEDKPHAWYQATNASADVAALAAGIADASRSLGVAAGTALRSQLRASAVPADDVVALAHALTVDLSTSPENAWLLIDDYHLLAASPEAEEFIDTLFRQCTLRMAITSRHRPQWATARRILYGEVLEVGKNLLAMTHDEARHILAFEREVRIPGLVALAEGWPAVIGLAAVTRVSDPPSQNLPTALYEYFAEELYQQLSAPTRPSVAALAVAPSLTREVATALLGESAASVLEDAARVGMVELGGDGATNIHPLLRRFLQERLREDSPACAARYAHILCLHYSRQGMWDEAHECAEQSDQSDALVLVLENALDDLLAAGRLDTVVAWTGTARAQHATSPVMDLAVAEVAFRHGEVSKALASARRAAERFPDAHRLVARAHLLAGLSAHRLDRFEDSIGAFDRARREASLKADAWQALWGRFLSTISLERPEGAELLDELLRFESDSADVALRRAIAPALFGSRMGTLRGTIEPLEDAAHFLDQAEDPLARSAFLDGYAHRLVLAGRYDAAMPLIERQLEEAERYGLKFAYTVGLWTKAAAETGRRHFEVAAAALAEARRRGETFAQGPYSAMNVLTLEARLRVVQRAPLEAVALLEREWDRLPEASMVGEYTATHALALACAGRVDEATQRACESRAVTRGVEANTLAACVDLICAIVRGPNEVEERQQALFDALHGQHFDALVSAYRGFPSILPYLAPLDETLRLLLVSSHDRPLGRRLGLLPPLRGRVADQLSKREKEVYALLCRGLKDREIAKELFISESTAKVHVRHIFEKLGVHSRAAAIALRLEEDGSGGLKQ